MIKSFFTCLVLCTIWSSSFSQKEETKGDTILYRVTLDTLRTKQPTTVTRTVKKKEEASYLILFIYKNYINIKFRNHSTHLDNENSLQKFIVDNKTKIDKTKVNIINEKEGSFAKFEEAVSTLKKNGITKYSLLSR